MPHFCVMSAYPPKADIWQRKMNVRYGPKADIRVMSALPRKADMCGALADVRFGSKADMGDLYLRFVSALMQTRHSR
jgi:hypothetical protein